MKQFEYMTIRLTSWRNENDASDELINRYGGRGWELSATYETGGIVKAIFKRTIIQNEINDNPIQ